MGASLTCINFCFFFHLVYSNTIVISSMWIPRDQIQSAGDIAGMTSFVEFSAVMLSDEANTHDSKGYTLAVSRLGEQHVRSIQKF